MTGFIGNIEELTIKNTYFRKVLFTGPNCQLVVMSLKPGEEIGAEVHQDHDQFIRIEAGQAKLVINDQTQTGSDGFAIVVPAGANHNVINIGKEDLKLYTIYSPAEHPDGTIHKTQEEAQADEKDHL